MFVTIVKRRWQKLNKKFCVTSSGLTKEQRKEFATELNEFVKDKKAQFKEESQIEESEK